jgi:hypothetical protein
MKSFEPRSMMQEHLHFIKRASVEEEKNSWTAPAHTFLNYFEKIVAPSFERTHSYEAHLYCNVDKKTLNSFNAGR